MKPLGSCLFVHLILLLSVSNAQAEPTVARIWNEQLLDAIRNDTARPTVHARNLYHTSIALFDTWASFDEYAAPVLHFETPDLTGEAAIHEAMSYAAYGVLRHRFVDGPGGTGPGRFFTALQLEDQMIEFGYDPYLDSTEGSSAAAFGNRVAQSVIDYGLQDGANEKLDYLDPSGYSSVNRPMVFDVPGTEITDPNRWQPLKFLRTRRDQFGEVVDQRVQEFLSPYWGDVKPFALHSSDRSTSGVYLDQGAPPLLNGEGDEVFREAVNLVIRYSATLDPAMDTMIDVSPQSLGNSPLGTYQQNGHALNPYTGEPYEPQFVNKADWGRVVAEFWADGPESEAPPGHWNVIGNDVADLMDQMEIGKRIGADGPVVSNLEWDVKMYLALNGAIHDAGIAAWNHKGHYDYSRPVSMIRYMGQMGQSSDPNLTVVKDGELVSTFHPDGLQLDPGLVEVITHASSQAGGRHEHLGDRIGEIAVYSWQGPPDPPYLTSEDVGGVGWVLAEEWLPYQRDDFVTPPFAAYLSGHSTFSRAGAEVLTRLTGNEYFPGGLMEYPVFAPHGLDFEYGPTSEFSLQWATYYDASDEAGLSRIYGGIHVPADDLPGRMLGAEVGAAAWERANHHFRGVPEPSSAILLVVGLLCCHKWMGHRRPGRST